MRIDNTELGNMVYDKLKSDCDTPVQKYIDKYEIYDYIDSIRQDEQADISSHAAFNLMLNVVDLWKQSLLEVH